MALTVCHVEHLCEHCGIVRVGADGPFPAPYDYSVTFVRRGGYAEIVGFDHKGVTPSEFELVISSINKATGILVAYDRAGPPPIRVVQIDPGLIKGKIRMAAHKSKTHVHSPEVALKDGKVQLQELESGSAHANQMFLEGKEIMLDVKRLVLADGSVIDMFHHVASSEHPAPAE